jgi:hypothetical protein
VAYHSGGNEAEDGEDVETHVDGSGVVIEFWFGTRRMLCD